MINIIIIILREKYCRVKFPNNFFLCLIVRNRVTFLTVHITCTVRNDLNKNNKISLLLLTSPIVMWYTTYSKQTNYAIDIKKRVLRQQNSTSKLILSLPMSSSGVSISLYAEPLKGFSVFFLLLKLTINNRGSCTS